MIFDLMNFKKEMMDILLNIQDQHLVTLLIGEKENNRQCWRLLVARIHRFLLKELNSMAFLIKLNLGKISRMGNLHSQMRTKKKYWTVQLTVIMTRKKMKKMKKSVNMMHKWTKLWLVLPISAKISPIVSQIMKTMTKKNSKAPSEA